MEPATISPGGPLSADMSQLLPSEAEHLWHARAACKGHAELFFPERGEATDEARSLCAVCDVRAHCLEVAVDNPKMIGLWAGTTVRDRVEIRRRRRIQELTCAPLPEVDAS
jgi:WhiB family redox-sensing transcriptional regulator